MTTCLGNDAIKTLSNGKFRAFRQCCWWVGDFGTFGGAQAAIADPDLHGIAVANMDISTHDLAQLLRSKLTDADVFANTVARQSDDDAICWMGPLSNVAGGASYYDHLAASRA